MMTDNQFHRPRFLILDALNTLIGLNPDYVGFFTEISRRGGLDPAPDVVAEALTHEYAAVRRALVGKTDFSTDPQRERLFWHVIDKGIFHRIGFSDEQADALAEAAYEEFDSGGHFRLLPPALGALERIRAMGIPMGIISNGTEGMDRWMRQCPFAPLMEFILVSVVVGWEKPGAEIFRLALERAGVAPQEALYAGDSYDHDILGARGAGIPAVCIGPRALPDDAGCLVLDHIGQLPDFIAGLPD